jgi:hypothetical protein
LRITDLALEVFADELQSIVEGAQRDELHLSDGLLLPSALDDGRQDLVRLGAQNFGLLL